MTSFSLEDQFYEGLKEIAADRGVTVAELIAEIDQERREGNLSSTLRVYVLAHYQERSSDEPTPGEIAAHEHRLAEQDAGKH